MGGGASVETAASVTEVAMELGYSSAEHFSGAFRRFYGLSPRRTAAPRPAFRAGLGPRFPQRRPVFPVGNFTEKN